MSWFLPLTKAKLKRSSLIPSRMPKGSICAEVGVYEGDFSDVVLREAQPRVLHLIDPWKFEPDPHYAKSWYGGAVGKSQDSMDSIYESICGRFASQIKTGVVRVHRTTSLGAASEFQDGYFDWVYIDGNHQYDFVKQDLELYFPKVKHGGFIAGDDYHTPGWWNDGVTKAVDEFLSKRLGRDLQIALIMNREFILQKL